MIYIDPPYNTGNDFVYKDDFGDNLANYKEVTSQGTVSNPETAGRYHTNWLNMMYPRLRLVRNLLRDDGVIFISIDDNEVGNLRKICDELFGEENFVAQICHKSRASISNDKIISPNHNAILFYAKNHDALHENRRLIGLDPNLDRFDKDDNDGRGAYRLVPVDGPGGAKKGNPHYEFMGIMGYWRFSKETMQQKYDDGYVVKHGNSLSQKYYKSMAEQTRRTDTTWWDDGGLMSSATSKLKELMGGASFDTPKPVELIKRMLKLITAIDKESYVLDFFAGSSTTAQAVMELNAEDNGNRKFIMVQLPELLNEKSEAVANGYKTVTEIGKERIRRAGKQIDKGDVGFKVYKLDTSNLKLWDTSYADNDEEMIARMENRLFNIKPERTELDLVHEIALKLGELLTVKINELDINGKTMYGIGSDNKLIVCLAENITPQDDEKIASYPPPRVCNLRRPMLSKHRGKVQCKARFERQGHNAKIDMRKMDKNMKLKFIKQAYQTDAVNSIVDLFRGQEKKNSIFSIVLDKQVGWDEKKYGIGNVQTISNEQMLQNMHAIQRRNTLKQTDNIMMTFPPVDKDSNSEEKRKERDIPSFCIDMETATGKTYVFTKTIFELNKQYGFTKFIIVVPSVAIREGVKKSLDVTAEHFANDYNNVPTHFFIYNSKKLTQVRDFATSSDIEIMIINIDAFRKNEKNLINQDNDKLNGVTAMQYIQDCSPIVIIDEPQSVDTTDKSQKAIADLNPLAVLRYSATHKNKVNTMHKLTPVDAYQKGLVKQICVSSNSVINDFNKSRTCALFLLSKTRGFLPKLRLIELKTA